MRAAGYKDEKSFFKAVEAGKILSKDVLPKFAEELKKMARANGALAKVTEKTRAETNRFFNQLYLFQTKIFEGGYGEGLAYMFGNLADSLKNLQPLAKTLGRVIQGVMSTATAAAKVLITPLELLSKLFEGLGIEDSKIWAVVGATGSLALLAARFEFIRKILTGVNTALLITLKRIAALVAVPLILEDVAGSAFLGKKGVTSEGGAFSAGNILGDWASWMDKPIGSFFSDSKVTIEVKGDEAAKFIQAQVEKTSTSGKAVTQAENAQ